jgi:NADH:ubiquinone reductase (H+-translocating)
MGVTPRVVIIGGGFGGLYAARALADEAVQVTVIDRRNHHLFAPLLYQVATASLNPSDIAEPIRSVLRKQRNAEVLLAEVTGIEVASRRVILADGAVPYDYLVVAAGTRHSYFGNDEWELVAPGLKSIEDALDIRRRMLFAYEAAEREDEPALTRAWLTFVVVGGGPTGVEMAGAMAEVAHRTLHKDFRNIDPTHARVLLVEGQDRVLPGFDEALGPPAQRQLERLRVELKLGVRVTAIDPDGVTLAPAAGGDPERIAARTVIWAAGVAASPLARSLGVPLDRAGRVLVTPDLAIPGHDEVFVIGDLASLEVEGKAVPGLAPAAIQAGRQTADNILRRIAGKPTRPFRYRDKGSLATIGRAAAVGTIGSLKVSGFIAWFMWAVVHLFYLVGFRNRVFVFLSWAWSYLTFSRGARLITELDPTTLPTPRRQSGQLPAVSGGSAAAAGGDSTASPGG